MRATFLLPLVVVLPAWAAPKADHEVKPGGFAKLSVPGVGKTVLWTVSPVPIQEDEFAGVLVFTGMPGVEYNVTAVVIDFDKKTAEKIRHTVRFGAAPVPPGPDPIPPVPPGPLPPLPPDNPPTFAQYATGMTGPDRALLAAALRVAASKVPSATSRGDVQKAIAASVERVGVVVPEPLVQALDVALSAVVPSDPPEAALSANDRTAIVAVLRAAADSLTKLEAR